MASGTEAKGAPEGTIDLRGDERPAGGATPAVDDLATLHARLARIEALVGADLDKLGPAVLADSVRGIDLALRDLEARLAAVDVTRASGGGDDEGSAPVPAEGLAELHRVVSRLDRRVLAQSRYLAAVSRRGQGDADDVELAARIDALAAKVDALTALAEEPVPPDPAVERLSAVVEAMATQVHHLARQVRGLVPRSR